MVHKLKNKAINLIYKLPYIRRLFRNYQNYLACKRNSAHPAGHFYSPIVSVTDIKKREAEIWKNNEDKILLGINLQTDKQIVLLSFFFKYYNEIPFTSEKQTNIRYFYENDYYSYTDGIILYSMIRHFKPKKIIEIGSGFSSAVMLDTNELFFDSKINLIFIEPYLERLYSLLKDVDKTSTQIIKQNLQQTPIEYFEKLQSGDILFIDSTHVVKTGSDVNYILFEILPKLKPGVLIHFHDIFYPFEYPKEWVFRGRNWNESYFLKSFLMYNNKFEVILFSDYIHLHHKEAFKDMPLTYKCTGGNLWLRKK